MSSQTTPSRPHAARMAYAQRRTTRSAPARAKISLAAVHNRPCHAPSPLAHAGRARSHGRALTLLDAPWRERSRSGSGHCVRGRRGGGGSGSRAADRAASGPSRGMPTAERTQGSRIDRRVSSASTTSRAARPAEYIVVLIDALTPGRLPLHLVIISRIDLLLRKGQEART